MQRFRPSMYIYIYTHTHTHTHVCVCVYIYIHTYIYTARQSNDFAVVEAHPTEDSAQVRSPLGGKNGKKGKKIMEKVEDDLPL
jgi:hypothetical protein